MINKERFLQKSNFILLCIMFCIGILFFFVLGINTGYVLQKDSYAYIESVEGAVGVMPIYPLFLKILRIVFGEDNFLKVAVCMQGLAAIFTSIILALWMKRKLKLKNWESLVVYILSFLPYGFSLPEEVVSHEIMTESLAFSLFYLYFIVFMEAIATRKKQFIYYSVIFLLLLIGLRKQLIFLIAVSFLWVIYLIVMNHKKIVGKIIFLITGISLVVCLMVNILIPSISHLLDGSQIIDALLGKSIYVSCEEDIELFENSRNKEVFKCLYNYADEEKMLYKYSKDSKQSQWEHVLVGINFSTRSSWSNIKKYCEDENISLQQIEYFQTEITYVLVKNHVFDLIKIFLIILRQSLVSAIFIKKMNLYNLCEIITLIIVSSSVLLRICVAKLKNTDKQILYIYDTTILILSSNLLILNMFFMGIQRYVVYTFGLFYISNFLILNKQINYVILKSINKKKNK